MVEAQLIDYENSNHDFKVISINELSQAAKILSENIVSNINDLCFTCMTTDKIRKIVQIMPVMHTTNKTKSQFINMHEFVYTPGVFEAFLICDQIDTEETEKYLHGNGVESDSQMKRKGFGGQPSIVSRFPHIVDEVAEFVNNMDLRHRAEGGRKQATLLE